MKLSVVWIDRERADIFHFSNMRMERKKLTHPDPHEPKGEAGFGNGEKKLFQEALAEITDSKRILIVGPSVAKHHFRTFLMEQHPMVAKKITAMEVMDHPSDGQIAALVKRHFDKVRA